MEELRDYRVVNKKLVRMLAMQLGLLDGGPTAEAEVHVSAKLLGASYRSTWVGKEKDLDDPRLLSVIVEELREREQLQIFRPERTTDVWSDDHGSHFIYELLERVVPVYLPLPEGFLKGAGPKALTVWVSDPLDSGQTPTHPWDFVGSFLYLVEEMVDSSFPGHLVSGISALRALVDVVAGYDPPEHGRLQLLNQPGRRNASNLGEPNPLHPIEKLKRVGGIPGTPRNIETVYKIAYMTNEQATTILGKEVRLNDILAYPLFVAVR